MHAVEQSNTRSTPGTAFAAAVLAIFMVNSASAGTKIYSPTVEQGELEIESRGIVDNDNDPSKDGAAKIKSGIGYGFTDFWFAEAYAKWSRDPGGAFKIDGVELESLFRLAPPGKYWADFGLLAEYSIATQSGDLDELEITPILEKQIGQALNTLNLTFVKEIGSNAAGLELEYAWATRWRFKPYFQPGLELHGEFGELGKMGPLKDQEHQFGPAITGTLPIGIGTDKIHYEAAYLFGLTDASPDGAFRWLLEYELRF